MALKAAGGWRRSQPRWTRFIGLSCVAKCRRSAADTGKPLPAALPGPSRAKRTMASGMLVSLWAGSTRLAASYHFVSYHLGSLGDEKTIPYPSRGMRDRLVHL